MTCIVGLIDKENVIIGGDSLGSSSGQCSVRKDKKIFKKKGVCFGSTGSYRFIQLLQYFLDFELKPDMDEFDFSVKDLVPAIISTLKTHDSVELSNGRLNNDSVLMVGINNRLFTIYSDFQVEENIDPFQAIGSGGQLALGSLATTYLDENLDSKDKLLKALEIASRYNTYCSGPYHFISTGE